MNINHNDYAHEAKLVNQELNSAIAYIGEKVIAKTDSGDYFYYNMPWGDRQHFFFGGINVLEDMEAFIPHGKEKEQLELIESISESLFPFGLAAVCLLFGEDGEYSRIILIQVESERYFEASYPIDMSIVEKLAQEAATDSCLSNNLSNPYMCNPN